MIFYGFPLNSKGQPLQNKERYVKRKAPFINLRNDAFIKIDMSGFFYDNLLSDEHQLHRLSGLFMPLLHRFCFIHRERD